MNSPKRAWSQRRELAGALLYWSGAGHIFQALTHPTGAIVLMYHSVAPSEAAAYIDPPNRMSPSEFAVQMAFLQRHRTVISLSALLAQIESGKAPVAGTVCITIDDGYLDTLTTAAPILEKYRLPATIFVPTAYIGRAETQWADTLFRLLRQRTVSRLSLPDLGLDVDLTSDRNSAIAREKLHCVLLESAYPARTSLLQEIERQLRPEGASPRLTMNWQELRELARRYPLFEIGGHSQNHTDLAAHRGDFARAEIRGCAEDLRRELGREPQHFCFPYGRWCEETRNEVRAAGWRSAWGASTDFRVGPTSDRYLLARVSAPSQLTALRFQTSGAFPGALTMFGLRYHGH